MYLGDNLIQSSLNKFLQQFATKNLDALTLLCAVENPTAFGVAKVDAQGKVLELIEKPKEPPSNLALVGVYLFSAAIHQAIAKIKPSARGELEITDAIQYLIDQKKAVEAFQLEGWWLDTGKKDDLLAANQIILDACLDLIIEGEIDSSSKLSGRINIGSGSRIVNSTIRGPVTIGNNCHIENCFIGPYTSIADETTLIDTDIEHSVILKGAKVIGIHQRIVDSLIGERAQMKLAPQRPKALRFMIGDDSQIELT
jgi:glucose-1-phosphate thymidylyltransferase